MSHDHAPDTLPKRRAGKYPTKITPPSVPFGWAVSQNTIKDHDHVNKFGFCAAVGATPAETIWTLGGRYVYETVASKVNVKSGSVEDDVMTVAPAPGTGAWTVQIYGLSGSYTEQNEVITMNGQVDVVSTLSYLRLNRMVVRSAGTGAENAGAITAKDATNTRTMASIATGDNQTLMALWTIPADHDGHMAVFWAGSATAKTSLIDLVVRPLGEVFQVKRRIVLNASHQENTFVFTEHMPEKSDIEIIGITTGGGGAISAGFDMMYHHH